MLEKVRGMVQAVSVTMFARVSERHRQYITAEDIESELWLRCVRYTKDDQLRWSWFNAWRHVWAIYYRLRKQQHIPTIPIEECGEVVDPGKSIDTVAVLTEIHKCCKSDRDKQMVNMFVSGMTAREIAKKLGITYQRVYQLRKELYERYQERHHDG